MRIATLTLALSLILLPARPQESNWSQWRGPNFNGSSPAKNLPDKIAAGDALWSTPMPGHSNGPPIVHGDRIFTTAHTPDGKLLALAVNKADGKILWQKETAQSTN